MNPKKVTLQWWWYRGMWVLIAMPPVMDTDGTAPNIGHYSGKQA